MSEEDQQPKQPKRATAGTALRAAYRREREQPGTYLMPPSEFCEAQIASNEEISVMARRVLLGMLQHAAATGRGAEPDTEFRMRLAELRPSTYSNNQRVREALIELKRLVLLVPVLSSRGRPATSVESIFSRCVFEKEMRDDEGNALVEWRWDEGMRRTLADARLFADMERAMVNLIESQYALALFQLGSSLVSRHQFFWEGSIDELRRVLGVGYSKRAGKKKPKFETWKDLRRWVLEPAVLEVSQLAPFIVVMTPIMKAGAYTHMRLDFVKKDFMRWQQDRQFALNLSREERLARRDNEVRAMMVNIEQERLEIRELARENLSMPLQQILNAPRILGSRRTRKLAGRKAI